MKTKCSIEFIYTKKSSKFLSDDKKSISTQPFSVESPNAIQMILVYPSAIGRMADPMGRIEIGQYCANITTHKLVKCTAENLASLLSNKRDFRRVLLWRSLFPMAAQEQVSELVKQYIKAYNECEGDVKYFKLKNCEELDSVIELTFGEMESEESELWLV